MSSSLDVAGGLGGLVGGLINIGYILMFVIFISAVMVGVFFLVKFLLKYSQYKVFIWDVSDNGSVRLSYDKAGIFLNKKTGHKLLYLKKSNVGLNPDIFTYLFDDRGKKIIYLLRYGYKNFVFINPVADTKGNLNFKVGEEDVNWAINSYESNKKRFSNSLLVQLLPFMVLALVCIIILILMISLFKQFSVFSEVATAIREASSNLASMKTGGII
jgi:hypothetical protein